jgi:hypothetical protein
MREVIGACTQLLGAPVLEAYSVVGAATGRYVSEDVDVLVRTSGGPFYVTRRVNKKTGARGPYVGALLDDGSIDADAEEPNLA